VLRERRREPAREEMVGLLRLWVLYALLCQSSVASMLRWRPALPLRYFALSCAIVLLLLKLLPPLLRLACSGISQLRSPRYHTGGWHRGRSALREQQHPPRKYRRDP